MQNGHFIEPFEPFCFGLIFVAALAGILFFVYDVIKKIRNGRERTDRE